MSFRPQSSSSGFGRLAGEDDFFLPLTSLIDVVFLLLIFFMVSTSFVDFSKTMDIELPESKMGDALEKIENIVIEVTLEKEIIVNGKKVDPGSLRDELAGLKEKVEKASVLIRADKNLPYGEVVNVMSICHEARLNDIGVVVK